MISEDHGAVLQADADVVSCGLGDGVALLHMGSSTYYSLNAVGAAVWSLLQGGARAAEIKSAIAAQFAVDRERCDQDVDALIRQLIEAGLVRSADAQAGQISSA
jgi:hypothetical protein